MSYDPEWITANLKDMSEFCKANSMPNSAEVLEKARRQCEWEIRRGRTYYEHRDQEIEEDIRPSKPPN